MYPHWQKIIFMPSEQAIATAFQITARIQQRDREINGKDFAVFNRTGFEDENTCFMVYYFSPAVATYCADILAPYAPIDCEAPQPGDPEDLVQVLCLAYGTLQGQRSWDLLK